MGDSASFSLCPQDFFQSYTAFLKGLEENDKALVNASRRALRSYLGLHDYEYMVWQEWKEGFARWVENQIKRLLGLPENKGGLGKPYSRELFYIGDESYLAYLAKKIPG